jgi:superfamily II DNA or RNA helicase
MMSDDEWDFIPPDISDQELLPIVPLDHDSGLIQMRDYQQEAVDAVYVELQENLSTMVVMATGTGKTCVFSEIAYRWPVGRVMIIAHREELIDQAAEKIGHHLDEHPAIEMGDRKESRDGHGLLDKSKVLVTSVQTMSRPNRMQWFNPSDFGLIITDECHHSVSASYRRVYEHFHKNPQLRHVGVTATPKRSDEAALGDIFRTVAYEMDIRQGIDEGWLVDVEQKMIVVEGLDFSKCRTTAGDLNQKDIAAAWGFEKTTVQTDDMTEIQREQLEHQEKMLHAVVSPVIQEAQGRPTIIFATTKDHAERLCEICLRHPGVTAEFLTDDTDRVERKEIIARFRSQRTQILVNVSIATEGFDARVDVVAIARPTKSESLYRQMIGRGTRPLGGLVDKYDTAIERREAIANSVKPAMTVLDFLGASGRHNLISAVDVLAGSYTEDVIEAAKRKLRESGVTRDIDDLLAEEAQNATERKAKAMQLAKEKAERDAAAKERQEEERRLRQEEWDKRKSVRGHATYRSENVSPFDSITIPEQIGVGKFRGGATDKQVAKLMAFGVSEEKACSFSKGQAGITIDKYLQKTGGDFIVTIGKFKGRPIKEMPSGWLDWAERTISDQRLLSEIRNFRRPNPNNEPPLGSSGDEEVPF